MCMFQCINQSCSQISSTKYFTEWCGFSGIKDVTRRYFLRRSYTVTLLHSTNSMYPTYRTGPAQHSECTMNITCARLRVYDWLIDWLAAGVSTASAHCLDWWAEPCQVGERLHCSVTGQLELQDHQWLIHFSAFMLAVLDCNRHWLQLSE